MRNNIPWIISLILFLSILFLWSIGLIIFKWKYSHHPKLGFLSGKPITVKQQQQQQRHPDGAKGCCTFVRQPNNKIRIVFTLSFVLIFISSILLQRPGMATLLDGIVPLESVRLNIYKQVHSAYEVTNEITRIKSEIIPISDALLPLLDDHHHDNDKIDRNNDEDEKEGATMRDFQELAHDAYVKLSTLDTFHTSHDNVGMNSDEVSEISTLNSHLQHTIKILNNIGEITINLMDAFSSPFSSSSSSSSNKTSVTSITKEDNDADMDDVSTIHKLSRPSKIFIKFSVVPVVALSAVLVGGTALAWGGDSIKCYQRASTYGILPCFALLVLVGGLVLLICGSVSFFWFNDFCSVPSSLDEMSTQNSDTLSNVLVETESNERRFLNNAVDHYYSVCIEDNGSLPSFLSDYGEAVGNAQSSLQTLSNFIVSNDVQKICSECNRNFEELQSMSKVIRLKLQVLVGNISLIPHLLDCERFHTIHMNAVHSPVCLKTEVGLRWIVLSLSIMIFCAMVVVTLRSSWLNDEILCESDAVPRSNDENMDYQQQSQLLPTTKTEPSASTQNMRNCDDVEDASQLVDVEKRIDNSNDENGTNAENRVPLLRDHYDGEETR